MAATLDRDRDTASGATDASHLPATARHVRGPERASSRQRPLCEVWIGKSERGDDGGDGVGSSRNDEETEDGSRGLLCLQDTKWKADRARKMAEGYKMLHAGGDGRSKGIGIIVNVEISNEVIGPY